MKRSIRLVATMALSFLMLSACKTSPDPDTEPEEVTWERAVELVNSGRVVAAYQTHALLVVLEMEDGSSVQTIEPNIDEVMRVIDQCGRKCEQIMIATE